MGKIEKTINEIEGIDEGLAEKAQGMLDNLTKPKGSLGRLEEIARQIVGITGQEKPEFKRKVIFTLAADHGVTEEGISLYPKEVTKQMVYNFLRGGAGINVLARHVGAKVIVVDMGVAETIEEANFPDNKMNLFRNKKINYGTRNIAKGAAMTREEAICSIEAGIDVFEKEFQNGIDMAGTGDMGIGNTTSSSAIAQVVTGRSALDVAGRGTGIDDGTFAHKVEIIEKAIKINRPDPNDPIDILAKLGGFEIGGLSGIILAAASKKVPVIIDGFISGAALLVACRLKQEVAQYAIASHESVERGHKIILDYMHLKPLLNLGLRLGEGTGAALGMSLVEASMKILREMATFESASVSRAR